MAQPLAALQLARPLRCSPAIATRVEAIAEAIATGWRPSLLGGHRYWGGGHRAIAARVEAIAEAIATGWRSWLVGSRPSLLGWRPPTRVEAIAEDSATGWKPSLLGWRPSPRGGGVGGHRYYNGGHCGGHRY